MSASERRWLPAMDRALTEVRVGSGAVAPALLDIQHRDPGSRARTGVLRLAHGEVRTPAFVPLATKGVVKGIEPREVAALGYDMVLGNTFHLFLAPGHELVAEQGGLHEFMRWSGPIITDSGGFQVFSMGHGTVADEIKGRASDPARPDRAGAILAIEEEGVRFRSYIDGGERFMAPETSMEVQAALGSDIALAFDECTPFHVDRDYTERSTERTHRWLDRCLAWQDAHGRGDQAFYAIAQGGVYEDLRRGSTRVVAQSRAPGVAIGGSLGAEKPQMYEVVGWATEELERVAPEQAAPPARDRRDRRPRARRRAGDRHVRLRDADAARPPRHGDRARPAQRWRVDLTKGRWKHAERADHGGLPVPGVRRRLLARLPALPVRRARADRAAARHAAQPRVRRAADGRPARARSRPGRFAEVAAAVRGGAAPGGLA